MELKKWVDESRVAIGMLMVQAFATGLQLLSKIVLGEGTFVFALMVYRQLVAVACIAPFALYLEREKVKKLTWYVWFWLFIIALTGVSMATGLFYFGLRDTTATYATNFLNLIPVTTFILSILLRIEKAEVHTKAGKVKTTGALLCLIGALVVTLYKGKQILLSPTHQQSQTQIINNNTSKYSSNYIRIRGILFLIGSILSYSAWYILQVKLKKVFPYKYTCTTLVCIIASIQQLIIGLCIDRSPNSWKLGWNLQLVTIVYSGALATAATFCLISWAVEEKGPTYPSMFNPISVILVAITEALFLGQHVMSVGSLLGMCVIIAGLYLFLWGKRMEISICSSNMVREEQKAVDTGYEVAVERDGYIGGANSSLITDN